LIRPRNRSNRSFSYGSPVSFRLSGTLLIVLAVVVFLLISGSLIFVATVDLSAPSQPVEKLIPPERYQK